MIKANELRIGNYVITTDGTGEHFTEVKGICNTGINPFSGDAGEEVITYDTFENIKSIELTPEILEAFGFEFSDNDMNIDGKEGLLEISEKVYFKTCGTFNGRVAVLCLCDGNYFANNILYLHQLQNIYFDLTGEELEIKDNNFEKWSAAQQTIDKMENKFFKRAIK